eukprot:8723549-Pyramimonas_sp.AAC.1
MWPLVSTTYWPMCVVATRARPPPGVFLGEGAYGRGGYILLLLLWLQLLLVAPSEDALRAPPRAPPRSPLPPP